MKRKDFLKLLAVSPLSLSAMNLKEFEKLTTELPEQGKRLPVLFTSHGNPLDITATREERAFWKALYDLGNELRNKHEVRAVLVVSAHWNTRGTFVNINQEQKQIYDYYGFPEKYYEVQYHAKGAPEVAKEVAAISDNIVETDDWGLDLGPSVAHRHGDLFYP